MAKCQIVYIRAVANENEAPNRIKELREAMGLTQAALARAINTEPSSLNKIELGSRGLDQKWMRRIAAALECAPADLLPRSDNPDVLSEAEREMIAAYRRASERDREYFDKVADAIIPWRPRFEDKVA